MTKTKRLTVTESRAAAMCEAIKETAGYGGKFHLEVEWIDSRTWGANPRIMFRGEKCTNISGCGYCKLSACLASALHGLADTEEGRMAIARTQGAGVSSVQEALRAQGWNLESVASGKRYDCYVISRIAETEGGAA